MKRLVCLFGLPVLLFAGEIGGVELPNTLKVGDQSLALNGAGLRKKLFVKVYAGGLYLTHKNANAAMIIAADETMAIRMHFIYDGVAASKLTDAWNEGFNNATDGGVKAFQSQIDQFNGYFKAEAAKNDVYDVVYEPGKGSSLLINGEIQGTIAGLDFKRVLFGIWLCDKPADANLKKGMLGK